MKFKLEWPFKININVYDPLTHKMWQSKVTHRFTNPVFEMWQHVKYRLLGARVDKAYAVVETVDCSCDAGVHKRCLIRSATKGHAAEVAWNYNLCYQAMWMLRDDYDFLELVLPRGVLMTGKHKATSAPYYTMREFASLDKLAAFTQELAAKRREVWASGPQGLQMPFSGPVGGDGFDEESVSVQDVGGALMLTRKTTKSTTQEHKRSAAEYAEMYRQYKDKGEEPTN